jgi:small conductance mechanosensitive channel
MPHRHSTGASSLLLVACLICAGVPISLFGQETTATGIAGSGEEPPLAAEARELIERIAQDRAELADLGRQRDAARGEERLLLDRRVMSKGLETLDRLEKLVENVIEQEQQGVNAAVSRNAAVELVTMLAPLFRQRIEELQAEVSDLGNRRETTSGNELIELESEIAEDNKSLSTILDAALNNSRHMEALGLDATGEEDWLSEVLLDRAATEAARLKLSFEQIARLQERLEESPDDADVKADLVAAEAKRDRSTTNLDTTLSMMGRIGLDTAEYQTVLIEATGQITTDILDTEVAFGLFQKWLVRLRTWAVESGPGLFFKAFLFVLVLFVFRLLSRLIRKVVGRAVSNSRLHLSQLLQNMFVSISGNVILILGLLVALSQLGFALGPILAGLGIAGFIVGFALQEVLGNFAAGMMSSTSAT